MSEMIERVARAIASTPPNERTEYRDSGPVIVRDFERTARAAIEAMREPTEAQLEAAEEIVVGFDDFACGDGNIYLGIPGYPQKARDVWAALVDAALKETV
ncbi:hypothetical protein WA845_17685 [Agrobacterium sp. CMT1]|uniref:hypothetical protein n=1 Tax=Agrobacterium sp. CMT1 TaxID=3128901 RepID=UPI00307812D5